MLVATKEVTATIFKCDGCGKEHMVAEGAMPDGWHGGAILVEQSGADLSTFAKPDKDSGVIYRPSWYACTKRCIRGAVLSVTTQ